MSWEYACPKCKTMLNPGDTIALAMGTGEERFLVGLHPQPGKYEVFLPPNVRTENGSRWEFSCPLCSAALVTEDDENLCGLDLMVDGSRLRVLFSCIAGEHATFIMHEDLVRERHGQDAARYSPSGPKADSARA